MGSLVLPVAALCREPAVPPSSWRACGGQVRRVCGQGLGLGGGSFLWGQREFGKGWLWPRAVASSSVTDAESQWWHSSCVRKHAIPNVTGHFKKYIFFFASCSLFAVVTAGDNGALVLYTPPLWPEASCKGHAGPVHTLLTPSWLGLVVPRDSTRSPRQPHGDRHRPVPDYTSKSCL